jgi:hypothetical protein
MITVQSLNVCRYNYPFTLFNYIGLHHVGITKRVVSKKEKAPARVIAKHNLSRLSGNAIYNHTCVRPKKEKDAWASFSGGYLVFVMLSLTKYKTKTKYPPEALEGYRQE